MGGCGEGRSCRTRARSRWTTTTTNYLRGTALTNQVSTRLGSAIPTHRRRKRITTLTSSRRSSFVSNRNMMETIDNHHTEFVWQADTDYKRDRQNQKVTRQANQKNLLRRTL